MNNFHSIVKELDEVSKKLESIKNALNEQNPEQYVVTSKILKFQGTLDELEKSMNIYKRFRFWIKAMTVVLLIFTFLFLLSLFVVEWDDTYNVFKEKIIPTIIVIGLIGLLFILVDLIVEWIKKNKIMKKIKESKKELEKIT